MNKQVVIKDLLISYSETPGEGNQTLLFLHGWRSNKEVWISIIEILKNLKIEKFGYIALDFPGFGGSQNPPRDFTVGDYAEIVAEFIKKLDLKNVVIVGHSFGGRVGIKLASTHPELISKLVLVDSAGFAMDSSKKDIYQILANIARPFFKPVFMQGLRKKIYKVIGAEDYVATPELQKTFVNITSEDLSSDMKKIACPTLIINGENDKETPVEFGQRMNSLILNSKLLILKQAGHFSFLDRPEEFVKVLREFCSAGPRPAQPNE